MSDRRLRTERGLQGRVVRTTVAAALGAAATAAILTAGPAPPASAVGPSLTTADVDELIAGCLEMSSRVPSRPALTVAIVDTESNVLAVFHAANVPEIPSQRAERAAVAIAKAGTGNYFSSDEQTFSTRSAAFIIQDHFPPGIRFIPGGPLYGVEFSSLGTTDVNPIAFAQRIGGDGEGDPGNLPSPFRDLPSAELRIRGDLGGIGIYKNRRRVGGIGIDDGDARKRVTIPDPILSSAGCEDDYRLSFSNLERGRDLERIVLAGASRFLAPQQIRANEITVDGIRLPYSRPTRLGRPRRRTLDLPGDGAFDAQFPRREGESVPSRFADAVLDPPPNAGPGAQPIRGQMPVAFTPVRAGTDGILTEADVLRMLWQGARQASITRAAIRRPIGLKMQCWIAVVDTNGEVLGVFRFQEDATLFSYDVAVQKARTAAFFSDDRAAFSCRGVGLFSQAFYPAGQQDEEPGPMFQVQDGISVALLTGALPSEGNPIRNGITIFPGGVPLYKGGRLAGGIGVSGDGVDQDDIVADLGSRGFGAPGDIRCDALTGAELKRSLRRTLDALDALVPAQEPPGALAQVGRCFLLQRLKNARRTLEQVPLTVTPSYVKHPRHPGPVTIR
jgi:uncharacterized protein GlcG (DUF336 family)